MSDTRIVLLALSPYAAQELEDFIKAGGQPKDAHAGHPVVIDQIVAELTSQLNSLATGEPATPVRSPLAVTKLSEQVAAQMAAAGAEAIRGKP